MDAPYASAVAMVRLNNKEWIPSFQRFFKKKKNQCVYFLILVEGGPTRFAETMLPTMRTLWR